MANGPLNQVAKSLNDMTSTLGNLGLVICGFMVIFVMLMLMFGDAASRARMKNHLSFVIFSTGMVAFLSFGMKVIGNPSPSASQQPFTPPATKRVNKVEHRPALTYGKHIQYNSNSHMHMMTKKSLDHPKIVDEK